MASTGEARATTIALAAGTLLCIPVAVAFWQRGLGDRLAAAHGAQVLLSGHFDVYSQAPEAQMGPLALLLAGLLPRVVYVAMICLAMPAMLLLASELAPAWWTPRRLFFACALLAYPWTMFGVTGHGDEALLTVGGIVMAWACMKHCRGVAAVAFVVAMAGKPTALLLLPLLLCIPWRYRLLALAWTAVVWLPFVLADPVGFLAAGGGVVPVMPGSMLDLFGMAAWSDYPSWLRPLELLVAIVLGSVVVRRSGPAAALVAVLVVRVFMEPGAWAGYSSPLIAAALLADAQLRRRVPWVTVLAVMTYVVSFDWPMAAGQGIGRLAAAVGAVWFAAASRGRVDLHDGAAGNSTAVELGGGAGAADSKPPFVGVGVTRR